jgi:Na+:H+ antiporter, NhaA family
MSNATTARPTPPLFAAVLRPLQAFFRFEAAGGVLMLAAAIVALVWANSPFAASYQALFHLPFRIEIGTWRSEFSFHELINDGLMTFFFFVVGMEIKRELVLGELRTVDRALLPAIAALGGMAAPALIYAAFNWGTAQMSGWAIPTATDIAFSIGVLTLLKKRIAWGLIVFLTALAIFDDIGGIAIIALFYGSGLKALWLAVTALLVALIFWMGRSYVSNPPLWTVSGVLLWYCVHHSGIHATISGVMLGLMVPSRSRMSGTVVLDELHRYVSGLVRRREAEDVTNQEILAIEERLEDLEPPLNRFVHFLHPWVAFGIVPLFALSNAGVALRNVSIADLLGPVSLGVGLGLFVGKQIGIFSFTWLAVRSGRAPQPGGAPNSQVWAVSIVGGIGFTVALFVADLSFPDSPSSLDQAKLGILAGSFVSALCGYTFLRLFSRPLPSGSVESPPAEAEPVNK